MKQVIIAVLIVLAIIGSAVIISKNKEDAQAPESKLSNNFYGLEDGKITLTEFGDFQCPGCASMYPTIKEVKEKYKDQIRFEFRHYPIVNIHPNAMSAHLAAQAAASQGMFWEMHDQIYSTQSVWSRDSNPGSIFEGYAEELGLDIDKYRNSLKASETIGTVNADTELGRSQGITGTPAFQIDGENIDTPANSVEAMSEVIDNAIKAKSDSGVETEE